jgi:hypothetical protein
MLFAAFAVTSGSNTRRRALKQGFAPGSPGASPLARMTGGAIGSPYAHNPWKGAIVFPLIRPALVAGAIGVIVLSSAASAAGRAATDGLNPPPPTFLTCKAVGEETTCSGTRLRIVEPVDTGIVCGSGTDAFDIFDQGEEHQRLTRRYDREGNLTRQDNDERWTSARWSNPLTGATVPYTQTNKITTVLAVPGDFGSATETTVGEIIFTNPETGKKVLRNVGRTVIGSDGTIDFRSGQQQFLDAFVDGDMSVFDDLCAALAS